MPQPFVLNRLFISYAWKQHEAYVRLLVLLKKAPDFHFQIYSVPEDIAYSRMTNQQLEAELNYQISSVDCVLVLCELYVGYTAWIQFEIDLANSLGKPIIAIKPFGSLHMPVVVANAAREIVSWDTVAILKAIREHSLI